MHRMIINDGHPLDVEAYTENTVNTWERFIVDNTDDMSTNVSLRIWIN